MPAPPPILDTRRWNDLLAALQAQAAVNLPQWTPSTEGDAGVMLQRIFSRLMEIALDRLNRVPEKNLLAFLDAMGVSTLSPTAAQVPLAFSLLKNSPPTLIPQGTQAGTKSNGQAATVTFETTEDLTVLPAQLASAYTIDPVWDRYTDQTIEVGGDGAIAFTPFVGTQRMPHVLYVGDEALLNFTHPASVSLTFSGLDRSPDEVVREFFLSLAYQYWSQGVLSTVPLASITVDRTEAQVRVELALPVAVDPTSVQGLGLPLAAPNRWLQAVLTNPFPDAHAAHDLKVGDLTLGVSSASTFLPDSAFSDSAPLDLTKEFLPFGQTPGVGSTFYIASEDAFAKPGSIATLSFNLKPADPPVVVWEYWDGNKWSQLPSTSAVDGTNGFTQNGLISLVVPAPVPSGGPSGGVAAWSNVWVRGRLTAGGYRAVPSIPSFNLTTSTKLAQGSSPQAASIVIDTSNLQANGNVVPFAGPGQVIQVENDYSIVVSASGATLNLSPLLPSAHAAGAPVSLLLTTPAAKTSVAVAPGATQITAAPTGPISPGNVLLIDDLAGPEFVTVKQVQTAQDTSGAAVPGAVAIILSQPTAKLSHAVGVTLSVVAPMNVQGFAGNAWVDTKTEFYPLGKNPGAGDFFLMYTFGGFFASFVASATGLAATPAIAAPAVAVAAPALAGGVARPALDAILGSGFQVVNNAVASEFAVNIGNVFGTISLGGWNLYTNPFVLSPQLCINIDVALNQNFPPVGMAWEYLNANGWQSLNVPDTNANKFLIDGPGAVTLSLKDCAQNTVNNQKGYWIRARITSGNYGVPISYVAVDPADPSKGYQIQPGSGNLHPPVLTNAGLTYTASRQPTGVVTQNGFLYSDQTAQSEVPFAPYVSVTDLEPVQHSDPQPAFYLGFDSAFPEQPVKLWVDAAPRSFAGSVVKEVSVAPSLEANLPPLRWEYFNGTAWSVLPVLDGTNDLTEAGAIEFLTPSDFQPLARFDANERYWIRARSSSNDPFNTQQLDGVYLNATAAVQAVAIANEIVGSSNGQSGQTFNFARVPVLDGQQVQVMEPEQPSGAEAAQLAAEEGADAVQVVFNTLTQQNDIWVRWHEVENFLASGPYNRHYTRDHSSGTLTFGDGEQGLIPPPGTNNITASYQNGGGAAGNVEAGAVAQLKSKLAGVGSVVNPVAADGGADAETVTGVEQRGPQVLKHRGYSVTGGDTEALAGQAAGTRVARAKCLSNVNRELAFEPGWVTVLIVPSSTEARPSPTSELLREVENYLLPRCFTGLAQDTPARLNVIGAGYIEITVAAEIVPQVLEDAQPVQQAVVQALEAYLHPLTGGAQGTGWEFGQSVYASKVNQLIEGVAGVDHVTALQLVPNVAQHRLAIEATGGGTAYFAEGSVVATRDGRKSALMAEAADASAGELLVKGFKERDPLARVVDVKVTSAAGATVAVTAPDGSAFNADSLGMPRGSVVMKLDGSASTRLAKGILPNQANVAHIVLETPLGSPGDVLTLFYPFPMTVSSVACDTLNLTVTGTPTGEGGTTITVAPFGVDLDIPAGTLAMSADGTRQSPLAAGFSAGQTGITQIAVADADFAASFNLGDNVLLAIPSQTVTIDPYQPEFDLPAGGLVATLDNRVRLPLLTSVPGGQVATSLRLADFASGEVVAPAGTGSGGLTIRNVEPVFDVVDMDANFLIYSGPHRITMVEE